MLDRHTSIVRGEPNRWPPALMLLALLLPDGARSQSLDTSTSVEVFAGSEQEVVAPVDVPSHRVRVEVYQLDGLHRLESALSEQLPNDPVAAQRVALQRIGQLDQHDRDALRNRAVGLAKALQYGLDRYPATVINATVVVYGTTDVELALSRYRSWQEERAK